MPIGTIPADPAVSVYDQGTEYKHSFGSKPPKMPPAGPRRMTADATSIHIGGRGLAHCRLYKFPPALGSSSRSSVENADAPPWSRTHRRATGGCSRRPGGEIPCGRRPGEGSRA